MKHYIKQTFSWIGFIIFFAGFLGSLPDGITWVFFLGMSALVFPPLMSYLHKKNKKPKKGLRIGLGIGLFLLAMIFSPTSEPPMEATQNADNTVKTGDFNNETVVSNDEVEASNSPTAGAEDITSDKASPDIIEANSSDTAKGDNLSSTPVLATEPTTPTGTAASQQDNVNPTPTPYGFSNESTNVFSDMKVHFIDVGQGDSTLIEADGHFMLIDAGEENQAYKIVDYLKKQGVKKLDYLIGTHPHSDHIGGLDIVINSFPVGKLIMSDKEHNTIEYFELFDAIEANNLRVTKPVVGTKYTLGDASFTILSPNGADYNDFNDYSVGIKLVHKNDSFILTGDAEEAAEKEITENGLDISADVIKLGHHGSKYSGYKSFLDEVNPEYAVISVGVDNQYDHPHPETLQDMLNRKIKVFRTDKQGTIIFTSDGNKITVNTNAYKITASDLTDNEPTAKPTPKPAEKPAQDSIKKPNSKPSSTKTDDIIVHITETGTKYHNAGCRFLSKSDIEITLDEVTGKYDPCSVCKPPVK